MKLFTKSSILKSTTVEIISPRILEPPYIDKAYKKLRTQSSAIEFPMLNLSGESVLVGEKPATYRHDASEKFLEKAQKEAEDLLAEANRQAAEIMEKAYQEKDELRISIEKEIRDQVTPLAQAEGYEKGLQEAIPEALRLRKQAKAYLELAQKALIDELHRADRELVSLCILISEKIMHTTLDVKPEILLNAIRNLTLLPYEKDGIKLHLSSQDWQWYKDIPTEDKPPYPVVIDESLKGGDVFVECLEGIFDAQIHVQLEKVKEYLTEVIDDGGLDGVNAKIRAI